MLSCYGIHSSRRHSRGVKGKARVEQPFAAATPWQQVSRSSASERQHITSDSAVHCPRGKWQAGRPWRRDIERSPAPDFLSNARAKIQVAAGVTCCKAAAGRSLRRHSRPGTGLAANAREAAQERWLLESRDQQQRCCLRTAFLAPYLSLLARGGALDKPVAGRPPKVAATVSCAYSVSCAVAQPRVAPEIPESTSHGAPQHGPIQINLIPRPRYKNISRPALVRSVTSRLPRLTSHLILPLSPAVHDAFCPCVSSTYISLACRYRRPIAPPEHCMTAQQ